MIITAAMARAIAEKLIKIANTCEYDDSPIGVDFRKMHDEIIENTTLEDGLN